jgi:hypothetical protein
MEAARSAVVAKHYDVSRAGNSPSLLDKPRAAAPVILLSIRHQDAARTPHLPQ